MIYIIKEDVMKRARSGLWEKFIFVMAVFCIVPFLYSLDVVNDIILPSNVGEHSYKDRIVKTSMTTGNVYTYVADKYTITLQPGQNVKISIWVSSATLSYNTAAGLRFYFPNEANGFGGCESASRK